MGPGLGQARGSRKGDTIPQVAWQSADGLPPVRPAIPGRPGARPIRARARRYTASSSRASRHKLMKNKSIGGLVYSTDGGRMCPACRRPVADCACQAAAPAPAGDGVARIWRESKGRGGKSVTLVRGLPMAGPALEQLGKQLRGLRQRRHRQGRRDRDPGRPPRTRRAGAGKAGPSRQAGRRLRRAPTPPAASGWPSQART